MTSPRPVTDDTPQTASREVARKAASSMRVLAPVTGVTIRLDAVPDPVFAQALVGPGAAIDPSRQPGHAVAPISGRVAKLHPYAYIIVGDGGRGVLVHLGIDTVQLKGAGFELIAVEGDRVRAGQAVVAWDPVAIEASGRSPVCSVVALDAPAGSVRDVVEGTVHAGDPLFRWSGVVTPEPGSLGGVR